MAFFLSELIKKVRDPSEEDVITDYLLFLWKRTYDTISNSHDFNKSQMNSYEVYQLEISSLSDFIVAFSAVKFGFIHEHTSKYLKRTFRASAHKYLSTTISESQYLDYRNKKFIKYHSLNRNQELLSQFAHPFICDFIESDNGTYIFDQSLGDILHIDSLIAQLFYEHPIFASNNALEIPQTVTKFKYRDKSKNSGTDIDQWEEFQKFLK